MPLPQIEATGHSPSPIDHLGPQDYPLPWTYSAEDACLVAANGALLDAGMDIAQFDAAREFMARASSAHAALCSAVADLMNGVQPDWFALGLDSEVRSAIAKLTQERRAEAVESLASAPDRVGA